MRRHHFARKKIFQKKQHLKRISKALGDVGALRAIALQGYMNNHLRRQIWPVLLGITPEQMAGSEEQLELRADYKHAYSEQIDKDVPRSMHQHDVTKNLEMAQRDVYRGALSRILHTMFALNPELHYIQGYHDICSVVLLVFDGDERHAFQVLQKLSWLHIRDALRDSLSSVVASLDLLFVLLHKTDPEVAAFLQAANVRSFCTLSWVLTWFSHDLETMDDVCRIFDFLLASHPSMVLYLACAFIVSLKPHIIHLSCDDGSVHHLFQRLPEAENIELLLQRAQTLFQEHPLQTLIRAHRRGESKAHISQIVLHKDKHAKTSELAKDSPLHAKSLDALIEQYGDDRGNIVSKSSEKRAVLRRRAFVGALAAGIVAIGSSALLYYMEIETNLV